MRRRRFLALAGAAGLAGCSAPTPSGTRSPGTDADPEDGTETAPDSAGSSTVTATEGPGEVVWERVLEAPGPQLPAAAIEPPDGGLLVAGRSGGQATLHRLAVDGSVRWRRAYGGAGPEAAEAVLAVSGGFVFAGSVRVSAEFGADLLLVRVDGDGRPDWTASIGGDGTERATGIAPAGSGYLVGGHTESFAATGRDAVALRTDPDGTERWRRTYEVDVLDEATDVVRTAGGYVLTGASRPDPGTDKSPWVIGVDDRGRERWRRVFETDGFAAATAAVRVADGGSAVVGFRDRDVWLVRLGPDGGTVWERTYGGDSNDEGVALASTADGGYLVGGVTESFGAGGSDGYLVKTDAEGRREWERTAGADGDEGVGDVLQTADGGYVLVGNKPVRVGGENSPRIDRDLWAVKFGG